MPENIKTPQIKTRENKVNVNIDLIKNSMRTLLENLDKYTVFLTIAENLRVIENNGLKDNLDQITNLMESINEILGNSKIKMETKDRNHIKISVACIQKSITNIEQHNSILENIMKEKV